MARTILEGRVAVNRGATVLVPPPDLVLANLDQATLMLCRDQLAPYVQQGARLLVSGVLVDQRQELVQDFHALGCIAPKSGNEPDGRRCSSRPLKVAKGPNPCR